MREVPLADDSLVGAVDIPAPAVKTAFELGCPAIRARGSQLRAAMKAGVVVGTDIALRDTGDDEGIRADVVDVIVTDLRDVLFPAGKLPGSGPQAIELSLGISGLQIAVGRDVPV